jgi:hypothetical protein
MKYTILINQVNVVAHGLHHRTDLIDWAILDYIAHLQAVFPHTSDNNGFIEINIDSLIIDMPILKIKTATQLQIIIQKLWELELIECVTIGRKDVDFSRVKISDLYYKIAIGDGQ